jgi:acyl-CoA synthetase (AMP-forming)/AMP-acid ligase II/acyl carrier protein
VTVLAPEPRAPADSGSFTRFTDRGDHPALVSASGTLTYEQLDQQVAARAASLGAERRLVAVEAANTLPALVAYLGALRGGHVVLLLPPGATQTDHPLLAVYDPDTVVGAAGAWEPDARRPSTTHELHPDLALLLSTSGSTGSPKVVRLSRANLDANAGAIAQYLRLGPADRAMTTLPMQYCYGLSVINSHLHAGGTLVLTELSVVDPCFWDLFRRSGATSFAGVPHTFDLLDRIGFADIERPTLRYVTQAGGRLHPTVVRRYAELGARQGWDLVVMYGQTEATARMAYLPPHLAAASPHAIGIPIPGGSFRIHEPDATGTGELVYRGANVMLGYATVASDLSLGATRDELHTGDLASQAPTGLYEIVGRRSRFIKPFGLRIDLDRLEEVLIDGGTPATCTGDDQGLVAAVYDPAHAPLVRQALADQVALPRAHVSVLYLQEVPRLLNGKPDHAVLRALAASGGAVPDATIAPHEASGVRAVFARVLGAEPTEEDTFVSLGGDSLSYVEMSVRLEDALGSLPGDWHLRSVAELEAARRPRHRLASTDTSAVLRAVAIVLVVATHVGLWHLPGGAHALLAVAGYNFARFQHGVGTILTSVARIALPSVCWITLVAANGDRFGWPNALLVNGFIERPGDRWGYWFIEALVQILVALAVVHAIPAISRFARTRPFALPMLAIAAGLVVRFDIVELTTTHRMTRPQQVFWLFALGWAAGRASIWTHRVAVSVLAAIGVAGFFGDTGRELVVLLGILAITWVRTLRVPRIVQRALMPIASASLYIYLVHWQVYPPTERLLGQWAAVAASIVVGLVAAAAAQPLLARVERAVRNRRLGSSVLR